ncbi:hypothetical protein B0H13DRAFT_1926898 [Mycena leptocephala]|nr:hypothetical protein B0H13DRAFT_1926898 [Mycena leptocephala]
MNASSFFGRLSPGFFAHQLGVVNMATAAAGVGAVLILSMIALKTVASVVVIGVLYGYCAGISLMAPFITVLTDDLGELGLRMGVGFAIVGLGGLIGPPINGALLTAHFTWWRAALFSGIMTLLGFTFFVASLLAFRRKERGFSIAAEGEMAQREKEDEDGSLVWSLNIAHSHLSELLGFLTTLAYLYNDQDVTALTRYRFLVGNPTIEQFWLTEFRDQGIVTPLTYHPSQSSILLPRLKDLRIRLEFSDISVEVGEDLVSMLKSPDYRAAHFKSAEVGIRQLEWRASMHQQTGRAAASVELDGEDG